MEVHTTQPPLKQFIKFCIVGGTAAVINFIIYYSATEYAGLWYVVSAVVAFLGSAVFNFSMNKLWTFQNLEGGGMMYGQMAKFAMVMVSGLVLNTTIIYLLTETILNNYIASWFFATGTVMFWSFGFNKFWTFRHSRQKETIDN